MKRIGIIGCGNMGAAIAERIKSKYPVTVFDKDKDKSIHLSGISVAVDSVDLAKKADTLILAVKPQDFDAVLNEVKDRLKDKLVISIAAGITTGYIEKILGEVKVVRVMPNICAKIGESQTILCKGRFAEKKDLDFAKKLFDGIGKTWLMKEEMMDSATAIAGSGPAYIYYDMEINKYDYSNFPNQVRQDYIKRLTEAAKNVGFDSQSALELAENTTLSSLKLTAFSGSPPSELRRQVTSPGGTTEVAIKILMQGGSWAEAALAAKKRAEELSKKE
ncbi:MAG: pyrroline-5-carboxylate reductase [Candidatus Omnitrophota bacterium]